MAVGGNDSEGIWIPLISDILGREIERGRFLIGLYDPAAHWLSLILTLSSTLLQKGYVVNISATNTPPREMRKILARTVPRLKEPEVANQLIISDMYTWQTGGKSDEAEVIDSLSLAKAVTDFRMEWLKHTAHYDFAVTDSFSSFLRYNDERAFSRWLGRIVAILREMKGIRLYSFIKRYHSDALYAELESFADGIIELDYREKSGTLEQVLRVKSMKGLPHPTDWRRLKVDSNGLMELLT